MNEKIDADTLLEVVLVLVVIWLVLEVLEASVGLLGAVLGLFPFTNFIGLVIIALIVLWLLDRI